MASNHTNDDIEPPDEFEIPQAIYTAALALVAVGVVTFLIGLWVLGDPDRTWDAYLIGFWFTVGLGMIGPFFIATQYLSTAEWYVPMRRIPEAFGNYLFVGIPLSLLLLVGAPHMLPWVRTEGKDLSHHALHFLELKEGFLNGTGLTLVTVLVPIVLCGLAYWMRRNSLDEDESGEPTIFRTNKVLSAVFVLLFGIGFSLMSWYWGISLEPLWYATMWQVYHFAGLFQTGLAVMTIITLILYRNGAFGDLLGEHQIHSLGQLVFAFTVFYAYISFCQFMLCWYANIPEEALFYIRRLGGLTPGDEPGGYGWFAALWLGKFILPFLILLPQEIKKNARNILYFVCWGIALFELYEIWFWVGFAPSNPDPAIDPTLYLPWLEIGVVAGFVGLFVLVVGWSLSSAPIVPLKDPFLHEAIAHGHHHGGEPDDDWKKVFDSS